MNQPVTFQSLQATVTAMQERGEDAFDPSRFHFIVALLNKAEKQKGEVAAMVQEKAANALSSYQASLNNIKLDAQKLVEQVLQDNQEAARLFESSNFKAVVRLAEREKRRNSRQSYAVLQTLFHEGETEEEEFQEQLSFDEELMAHENQLRKSFSPQVNIEATNLNAYGDLKSHKLFKDTWVKLQAEKIVADAIKQAPKDAGPLNSHLLAIRSIEAMKGLSPEYLNRFVSYMDSLLWLEQAANQLEASEQKNKSKGKQKGRSKK